MTRPSAREVAAARGGDLASRAFACAGDPLFVVAAEGYVVLEANGAARHELDLDPEAPTPLLTRVPSHERAVLASHLDTCLQTRQSARVVSEFMLADGERASIELTLSPMSSGDNRTVVAVGRLLQGALEGAAFEGERNQILEMIARHLPLEQVLRAINDMIGQLFPQAIPAVLLRDGPCVRIIAGEALPADYRASLEATDPTDSGPIAEALVAERPVIVADIEQDQRWGEATQPAKSSGLGALWIMPFAEQNRASTGAMLLHFNQPTMPDEPDLDRLHDALQLGKLALEEHETSRQLYERAYYDSVTRLPNRSLLHDRLSQAIEYAHRHDDVVAVIMLDLDQFKMVNDSMGHAIGDELLQSVASRFKQLLRSQDTVARLGGDEFVLVLPIGDADSAGLVADKVLQGLQRPIWLHGHRLSSAASMGIALYPRDGNQPGELLQAADAAMYSAKHAGRNRYHFHSSQLNARIHERISIESGLRRGLAQGELRAVYQPIVARDGERVVAIEALLRWKHPEQGLLTPGHFLAQAEESDLVCELDRWLWERAAADLQWLASQGHRPQLSVNVSPRDLQQGDFAGRFLQTLHARGLPPRRCELEITEHVLMPDVVHARNQIHELKRRAPELTIAIDDFGTGYASLNYLRDLPIDGLKIDRTFISDPGSRHDQTSRAIACTIAELGHHLDLRVTAEGVQCGAQLALTRDIGCDRVQGFFFARPMDRAELLHYLNRDGCEHGAGESPRLR